MTGLHDLVVTAPFTGFHIESDLFSKTTGYQNMGDCDETKPYYEGADAMKCPRRSNLPLWFEAIYAPIRVWAHREPIYW
jgi:hypothetical protein